MLETTAMTALVTLTDKYQILIAVKRVTMTTLAAHPDSAAHCQLLEGDVI
jgi:hypothetical protein